MLPACMLVDFNFILARRNKYFAGLKLVNQSGRESMINFLSIRELLLLLVCTLSKFTQNKKLVLGYLIRLPQKLHKIYICRF